MSFFVFLERLVFSVRSSFSVCTRRHRADLVRSYPRGTHGTVFRKSYVLHDSPIRNLAVTVTSNILLHSLFTFPPERLTFTFRTTATDVHSNRTDYIRSMRIYMNEILHRSRCRECFYCSFGTHSFVSVRPSTNAAELRL